MKDRGPKERFDGRPHLQGSLRGRVEAEPEGVNLARRALCSLRCSILGSTGTRVVGKLTHCTGQTPQFRKIGLAGFPKEPVGDFRGRNHPLNTYRNI